MIDLIFKDHREFKMTAQKIKPYDDCEEPNLSFLFMYLQPHFGTSVGKTNGLDWLGKEDSGGASVYCF